MSATTASADNAIITVLQTPLASLTTIAPDHVVYINKIFNQDSSPFIVCSYIPARPYQAGLGTYGKERFGGIFQIDVGVAIDEGRASINPIMAEIKEIYKRGTTLQNDEISVECKRVWESTPIPSDAWYIVPISVEYYAYVDNE